MQLGKEGLATMAQLSSTPKPNELTAGATYTVTITVTEPLRFDDVNAYFVTVPCKEDAPFSAPGHGGGGDAGPPAKPGKPTPPSTQEEPCEVPTEAPTRAPTMAPTKAPTPASCSDCVDKEPPSNWAEPTCAGQLASGQCAERVSLADGFCEATCGICVPCEVPCPTEEVPTMAPTKAPTKAPTSAPTAAPEEPCDTEDEIEPAKMEPPASCSDCVDKEPPSS